MESTALSRRDRERLARRRAMLDAALAVFAEKGYEGATLDEIAEQAEFGKGTLYNYFPGGKEAILFALFDELHEGLARVLRDELDRTTGDTVPTYARFHGLIAAVIGHFMRHRSAFLLLSKDAQRCVFEAKPEQAAYLIDWRDRIMALIEEPIREAIAAGQLRALPAHGVAHVLMGNIRGYLLYACSPSGGCPAEPTKSPDEAATFITTILFEGLLPRD